MCSSHFIIIIFILRMASAKKTPINITPQKIDSTAKLILSTSAFGSDHLLILLVGNGAVVLNGQDT